MGWNPFSSPAPPAAPVYNAPAAPDYSEVIRETNEWAPIMAGVERAKKLGEEYSYYLPGEAQTEANLRTADFTDKGDVDVARKMKEFEWETAPENLTKYLELQEEFGAQSIASAREQLELADPYGFAAREQLGEEVGDPLAVDLPDAPTLQQAAAGPEYERLSEADIPNIVADESELAGRRYMEAELAQRAEGGRGARRMGEFARRAARGRQAATGNIFGGGAAIDEARSVLDAEEATRAQDFRNYLGYLQSGQTAGDLESRVAQQNLANKMLGIEQRTGATSREQTEESARLAQSNQAIQQSYQNVMGRTLQEAGLQQQRFSNLQAFAFGQPLVGQLGSLSGMQQQAAGFMPTQVGQYGQGIGDQQQMRNQYQLGLAQNAANVFGTQADIYGTQAQYNMAPTAAGGFGKLLGTTIGAAGQAKGFGNLFSW